MVELKFQVSLSDFREASYFGMFMRKRNAFRVAVGVLLFTVVYLILWKCGVVHITQYNAIRRSCSNVVGVAPY